MFIQELRTMTDSSMASNQNTHKARSFQFGEEIEITEAGFSFHPIQDFELEIDGTVYMYADNGNLEIYLVGGELEQDQSIADLNDDLAAEFMENVGDYDLYEAGKDHIQGITGFLNEIRFTNAEEEGLGRCIICSPSINQFFFMLVIANTEYWSAEGASLWNGLKSTIQFHPQYRPEIIEKVSQSHPDLTTEIYQDIEPEEEFLLSVEKGDVSLLLAARSYATEDIVTLREVISPEGQTLYRFNPQTQDFFSIFCDQPISGTHGETCFFYPKANQQSLQPGEYRFNFATASGEGLEEIQYIIRSGRALGRQNIDLNCWLAMKENPFDDQPAHDQFTKQIHQALTKRLAPYDLLPGQIAFIYPAPDELESFSSINIDSDLADCSYMIAESVNNDRALNIGFVDEINQGSPPQPAHVTAISSGSPGMILSPGSPHACILVHWPSFLNNPQALVDAIITQLIIFSGIETKDTGQPEDGTSLVLNREIAWRLRRHPLFYDAA
jgi:hypothetical protein